MILIPDIYQYATNSQDKLDLAFKRNIRKMFGVKQFELVEDVEYLPKTGVFKNKRTKQFIGDFANEDYLARYLDMDITLPEPRIWLDGVEYSARGLAVLYMYGWYSPINTRRESKTGHLCAIDNIKTYKESTVMYDSLNGKFYSKRTHKELDLCIHGKSQGTITVFKDKVNPKQLAWLIAKGEWVEPRTLKHKNGNIRDNRLANLERVYSIDERITLAKLQKQQDFRSFVLCNLGADILDKNNGISIFPTDGNFKNLKIDNITVDTPTVKRYNTDGFEDNFED